MPLVAAALLTAVFGVSFPGLLTAVPLDRWQPETGDTLSVDTRANVAYLTHRDGVFTAFPVATGQRRVVRYIGRTYRATTPERVWEGRSLETKKYDPVTYGKTGRFLRLFHDGERTPYGIHGHRDSQEMLLEDDRFESMGCIIVSEAALDLLERTFALNGGRITVVTRYGIGGSGDSAQSESPVSKAGLAAAGDRR